MDIFFAVNDAYAKQLCVCIVSILENNKNQNIHFHVLSRDFSEKSKNMFKTSEKNIKIGISPTMFPTKNSSAI